MKDFNEGIAKAVFSGFYSGYFPFASGTAGSAAALAVWWVLFGYALPCTIAFQSLLPIALFAAGLWSTRHALTPASLRADAPKKVRDPSAVVIDEWVGMTIALIGTYPEDLVSLAMAFLLFRIFDVIKPGPVKTLEQLPGAWGIMLDDVAAGALALIVLSAWRYFL